MMERGSLAWWCGAIILGGIALWLQHSITSHSRIEESNILTADGLRRQAHHLDRNSIPHQLHSHLCLLKAKSLSHNATILNKTLIAEQELLQHEESVAKYYQELLSKTQIAIDECFAEIQNDTNTSEAAHSAAQDYMDGMYELQQDFNRTCLHFSAVMCDLVARFKGLHQQEERLAVLALEQEENAYNANMDKEHFQELETSLKVNETYYQHALEDVRQEGTTMQHVVHDEEILQHELEDNVTELLNRSRTEHASATRTKQQASQLRREAVEFSKLANVHGQQARLHAILALILATVLFVMLVEYLVYMVTTLRFLQEEWHLSTSTISSERHSVFASIMANSLYPTKPATAVAEAVAPPPGAAPVPAAPAPAVDEQSDASTVASSMSSVPPSEESPLIVSLVGSDEEEESSSPQSSYFTINLRSSSASNNSSLSCSMSTNRGGGCCCGGRLNDMARCIDHNVVSTLTMRPPWPSPNVELTVVVLAVAFATHLLFFQILPNMSHLSSN